MLTDQEYIDQSLETILVYSRNNMAKCLNMKLSLLSKEDEAIPIINKYKELYRNILYQTIDIASPEVIQAIEKNDLIYTEYSQSIKELTENLFHVEIDTYVNSKMINELNQIKKCKISQVTTLLNNIKDLNYEFKGFIINLLKRLEKMSIFMIGYSNNLYCIIDKLGIYEDNIERLLRKERISPVFVQKTQVKINEIMSNHAYLIPQYISQHENNLLNTGIVISEDFKKLSEDYQKEISPDTQKALANRTYNLIMNFIEYIQTVLKKITDKRLQVIIIPLFFDDTLREVNYYRIMLTHHLKNI